MNTTTNQMPPASPAKPRPRYDPLADFNAPPAAPFDASGLVRGMFGVGLLLLGGGVAVWVVVMIHRALFGSIERFVAVLVEHFAGAFPLWLAPVQARVLTVSEKQETWAQTVAETLRRAGIRAEADLSPDKLGAKIRRAQLEKIPYMLVVGDKEVENSAVSARTREGKQLPAMPLADLVRHLEDIARIPRGGTRQETQT